MHGTIIPRPRRLIGYAGQERRHWGGGDRRSVARYGLTARQEEALSYLIGLAPVGESFEVHIDTICADLGFKARFTWYQRLNPLVHAGYVRKVACGVGGTCGVLMVLRRPTFASHYGKMLG